MNLDKNLSDRLQRLLARVDSAGAQPHVEAESALDSDALAVRARDRSLDPNERGAAMLAFVRINQIAPCAGDLLLELLDDPNEAMVVAAIAAALPFDLRQREKLTALLDDSRDAVWTAAAEALGRRKERSLIPRFLEWVRGEAPPRRRVGLRALCWILNPHERLQFLDSAWATEWARGDDERMLVAELLAPLGHAESRAWLEAIAASDLAAALRARQVLRANSHRAGS